MKNRKLPSFVVITILTVITILAWIALDIFRLATKEPPPVAPKEVLNPLNPELDLQGLQDIEKRFYLEADEIPKTTINPIPSPEEATSTTTPTSSPQATATVSATPTASPSGEIN